MSEQHIHIHIGGNDTPSQPSKMNEASTNKVGAWYEKLLYRVKQCYDWKSLHELREEFNSIGLAVKETTGNRKILCRLENGKPVSKNIIDDYIFIGSRNTMDEEIGQRAMEVISHFIENNAGKPQMVVNDSQDYSRDISLYGKPIRLEHSDAQSQDKLLIEAQQIEAMGRMVSEDLE